MRSELVVLGAVLAGGGSRRMGTDKARLRLEGRSLLERAIDTLGAQLDQVVVVSGEVGSYPEAAVPELADRIVDSGPLAGLDSALTHAAGGAVFVLACDLPAVGSELVKLLIERARATMKPDKASAVVPAINGRLQPLCACYSPECAPVVRRHLESNRLRVLDLVAAIELEEVALAADLPFFATDLLDNLNDPAAAERWGIELPAGSAGSTGSTSSDTPETPILEGSRG